MRKLQECRKAETSGVASKTGVTSTSRAAQAMDIDESKFILATDYVHQQVTYDLAVFLTSWLLQYSNLVDYLGLEGKLSMPMVLVGDFNISKDDRAKLKEYLRKHFHLELKNDLAEQTTLNGSCIDLTFSRYMHLICKPYVSYFSYHYPVLNKITL
jgi:hypothetical protein